MCIVLPSLHFWGTRQLGITSIEDIKCIFKEISVTDLTFQIECRHFQHRENVIDYTAVYGGCIFMRFLAMMEKFGQKKFTQKLK